MTNTATALTDFILAFEAFLFAGLINPARRVGRHPSAPAHTTHTTHAPHATQSPQTTLSPHTPLIRWFELFFYAIAAASILGGAFHGYVPDQTAVAGRVLWAATMLSIGAAALAAWGIGATLGLPARAARLVIAVARLEFALYAGAVLFGFRAFRLAILDYLPATLFLLILFAIGYLRRRPPGYLLGALAMATTIGAAAVQQSDAAIVSLAITHNALYHLIQAVGLLLLYLSAQRLTHPESSARGGIERPVRHKMDTSER